jgi:hypothetical protein
MKQNKIPKEKKIRRLLLINSDNEMQKKIRRKNPVLINSMTPLELENSFQLYKDRINTSVSTYTNILEKHIVEQVVDIHKNINYYYSDFIENKKGRLINHRYIGVYSAKNFDPNYRDIIDGEEESEENEEDEKEEELLKSIIPFINKKKSVGTGKIVKDKSYSLVSPGYNFRNKDDLNNLCIDTCDSNSNNHHKCEKQKKRKKMSDMNNKLIYYCYTNLKRKRPLIIQNNNDNNDNNDNNVAINELYGLDIEEEYFNRMKMRGSTIKKNKARNKLNNDILSPKSSKNGNGSSAKKVKKNKHIKNKNKKNIRECVTSKNRNNNHISNFTNVLNNLKSKIGRLLSSDKKSIIKKSRLSQDNKFEKFRLSAIIKKHKNVNSNDNRIANVGESPIQNIISKLDTKTTSFDDNSSSVDNKNRNKNSKGKDIYIHRHKEVVKNLKKDNNGKGRFKYIKHSKLKHHQSLEVIKIRDNYKPNKKSLKEPIRPQFMYSLQKKVDFNFEENKKNFYKNKPSSKLSLENKKKSKSKKDCTEYEDISDDDKLGHKNKMGLYNIRDKNINSFLLKKNNTLDKRRKFSYNEYK